MAKPSWLSINPSTGSGNGTIANSASAHTGRKERVGEVTVTAVGVTNPVKYKVKQLPKLEFVAFTNGSEMAADKQAGKITVTGKSNSSVLTFSFVDGDGKGVEIPAKYTAAGVATNNGTAIDGDPGATAEYNFSVELDIPLNDTVDEVVRTLKVVGEKANVAAQIAITQTAGDARLAVDPLEITIPQDGTAVSVAVESNTTWSAS